MARGRFLTLKKSQRFAALTPISIKRTVRCKDGFNSVFNQQNRVRGCVMSKITSLIGRLRRDEDGAALIEYTVLLGIMVVAVIATIIAVVGWINGQWSALN